MFLSTNPTDGSELYRRDAESWQAFCRKLSLLEDRRQSFAALSVAERTVLLSGLAERLAENRDKLAHMICEEVGRCLHECRAELEKSIGLIRYYAALAPEILAHRTVPVQAGFSQVRFEPLGTVLAVMPWNYPIWQVLRFASPALCAGNACIVKPAPTVGRVTEALFEIVGTDLPFIPAWLEEADTLEAIAKADALAFTGSTATGCLLAARAGQYLKKSVLELGGSNAFIVMPDADLIQAAEDACYSRFRDAGQSCNAAKRIIVTPPVADEFLNLFLAECAKLKTGNPLLPSTTLAPLHRQDLRDRIHDQVSDAVANGARCLTGGFIPEGEGWFYPATVLDKVNPACRVYHEEVFGPAAMILRADDEEHAVALANDSPFGLGASIYTSDDAKGWRYAERIRTGSVFINRPAGSDFRLPFGGVKASGYGRELSEFGLYEFVNVKTYRQK